jgi:cell wall-associated NlpC family hydrolase
MNFLIQYAMSFIGVPYRWAGENPIHGFDCSGLVQEILRSVGMDPPEDQTAQALYNLLVKKTTIRDNFCPGAVAFYGKSLTQITHVAFMIDAFRVVEAGGGGATTKTKEDAALQNAFVRIRPVNHRKDLLVTLLPDYPADLIIR